jgi:hypothetical protein
MNAGSVGCRLLIEWFERGGFDNQFAETVRSELAKPKGTTAVINGLVMTAASLAHMTSAMLGTEPRLLLHSLGLIPRDAVANEPGT